MRKAAVVVLLLFSIATSAQKNVEDSFLHVLRVQKTDSLQTQTVLNWMNKPFGLFDSATYYPTQIIQTGQQQANTDVQALGYALLGYYQTTHDNPSLALEHYLKAQKLGEDRNNPRVMLRLYYFRSFYGDASESIAFLQQVSQLAKETGEPNWEVLANLHIGQTYLNNLQQYDSALVYLQGAYEKAQQLAERGKLIYAIDLMASTSLGYTFMKLNNPTLALAYFRVAQQTSMARYGGVDWEAYEGLATIYKETHNLDSSFYYAAKLYQLSELRATFSTMRFKVTASNLLYQIYKQRGNADSALKYHEIYKTASDSVNSIAQAQKVENLLSQEKERQAELGLKKEKEEETRKHNLQYAAIALGLVALLIGFLVLSHSVLANQKLIRFLGVVSLLIVFEFLNLLLHPWLGQITNESPVLMLLVMVALAAVLVPLHHRLEHWITHKLVEKNNKIRLAAAKKTIAKLEGLSTTSESTNAQQ